MPSHTSLPPGILLYLDFRLHHLEDPLRLVGLECVETLAGGTSPARLEEEHARAGVAVTAEVGEGPALVVLVRAGEDQLVVVYLQPACNWDGGCVEWSVW